TKLKNAAQTTARRGERTRVETTVAMLLAASWKPLRKSKLSATRIVTISSRSSGFTSFPVRHLRMRAERANYCATKNATLRRASLAQGRQRRAARSDPSAPKEGASG